MKTLPIILNNKKILLLGAGAVALQKASVLARNNIEFEVISKEIDEKMKTYTECISKKEFHISDIKDFEIIIDATGVKEVSDMLLEFKKTKNILLNVVDKPEICDFYFASLLEYGNLKIAVSSSGASPTITQVVRDKIKDMLPKEIENLTNQKEQERKEGLIDADLTRVQTKKLLSKVYLVGCGTGDVELLTLKAYKIIQNVDVVFIDHLISQEIIDTIPPSTEQVFVGKEKGFHSMKQEEINALLLEYAKQGISIARLKSGDPYIFGRGAEEAISLAQEGIRVEVIPGISSALAAPLLSGIAPTARGYATNLSIVSAHLAGNLVNLEWIPLLKYENHTVVILMGVSRAKEIKEAATKSGVNLNKDVAIISNASREKQSVVVGKLYELEGLCQNAQRPALIVMGDVVQLHEKLPIFGQ
jgi:uroporphyrin-III C-methyltransferase/precorrin-2 dehydrogenase/sirohydrochlorin ferrochelatase